MTGYAGRKALYENIQIERQSKVLLYVTGDRPGMETQINSDVVDIFVEHLDALWPAERISLVLYTPGGNTATAWRLINLLHTFCDELEVIVPSKALSAGTLMCLGANKIVMTKQAALGPIDPSLTTPLSPQIPGGAPKVSPTRAMRRERRSASGGSPITPSGACKRRGGSGLPGCCSGATRYQGCGQSNDSVDAAC